MLDNSIQRKYEYFTYKNQIAKYITLVYKREVKAFQNYSTLILKIIFIIINN